MEKAWELAALMLNATPHIPTPISTILRASQPVVCSYKQHEMGTSIPHSANKYLGNVMQTFGTLGSCFRRNERNLVVVILSSALVLSSCVGDAKITTKNADAFERSVKVAKEKLRYDQKIAFDEAIIASALSFKRGDGYVAISFEDLCYLSGDLECMIQSFADVLNGQTAESILTSHQKLKGNQSYRLERELERMLELQMNKRGKLNLQAIDAAKIKLAKSLDEKAEHTETLIWRTKAVRSAFEKRLDK